MRKIILPIPFLASLLLCASGSFAGPPDLASADWSVTAAHNLASNPPSDDAIMAFMSKLHDLPGYPARICFARFANLRRSTTLSLVVSENDGRFCHLFVVDKRIGGFDMYSFDLAHEADGPQIEDLAKDGNTELIVPTDVTAYEGSQYCIEQWPVIYAWTGSNYADVSSNYKGFYEQRLASLEKEITATEAENGRIENGSAGNSGQTVNTPSEATPPPMSIPEVDVSKGQALAQAVAVGPSVVEPVQPPPPEIPEPGSQGLNCIKAEAAKTERFLGLSSDAGMADAIKWKNSNDPHDREFATWVLADIGTPEAVDDLKTLSHDSNRDVATSAKLNLEQLSRGPERHVVEQESVPMAAINSTKVPTP